MMNEEMIEQEMSEGKVQRMRSDGLCRCQGAVIKHIVFLSISYRCLSR